MSAAGGMTFISRRLAFAISPQFDGDRGAALEFRERAVGNAAMSGRATFVEGFAAGAFQVWEERTGDP